MITLLLHHADADSDVVMIEARKPPSVIYRDMLRDWLRQCVHPEDVGCLPDEHFSDLTMDDLEAADRLAGELLCPISGGWPPFDPPADYRSRR
jgi:hypothetical protein